jgi:choline dehydrogenase-like flavoprotein
MAIEVATDVCERYYDAVIVGAGVAGALVAKTLSNSGARVLILEAGTGQAFEASGYLGNVRNYFQASAKVPNAPYANNRNAPQPDVLDVVSNDPTANSGGYLVQKGPQPFRSDYVRAAGGTTLHWLGTCLRMLPEDFETKSRFGIGCDWPLTYADLKPWYEKAEFEIGVSADTEDQLELARWLRAGDGWIGPDYVFPMHRIPTSYVDRMFREGVADLNIDFEGEKYPIRVTSTPQGRNSTPNERYPGGYQTVGAVGNPDMGHRCQGNSSCVPICPVQAKYNALKTLSAALGTGNVDLVTQAVASALVVGPDGRIAGVDYKAYRDPQSGAYDTFRARGTLYVLAAHAVENAKLMLISHLGGPAIGRYLMDHPVMLTWGLADRPLGTFRGPGSTSGIESLRGGSFRKRRAPFRVEIDNWGWNWATGAPISTLQSLVYDRSLFGSDLRGALFDMVQRQVRLGFLLEVPPDPANRITIDPAYKDRLDNYRPVISYRVTDYVRAGFAAAKRTSDLIYARLGIEDHTRYNPGEAGYVTYEGAGYTYAGAGHYVGGHVMGTHRTASVVNRDQRTWDHENLWMVGCGNMPTEGTSNPTLTMSALTLMAADRMRAALGLSR